MELSKSKKRIHERRVFVYAEYQKNEKPVIDLVDLLAKKYKVSSVTIYGDIKAMKGTQS